jgi:hypothetical protein
MGSDETCRLNSGVIRIQIRPGYGVPATGTGFPTNLIDSPASSLRGRSRHTSASQCARRGGHQIVDIADIQKQIDVVIRLIERLNGKIAEHDRLRRALPKIKPSIPLVQCTERAEKWWSENAQPLIDGIRTRLKPLRCEIEAYWSGKYSWDSFCGILDYGRDNYDQWKASGGPDIHIQELQRVSRALASIDQKPNGQGQTSANGGAHVNVNIQNSNVTMGDISQTQNLTAGNRNSIDKQTPTSPKNKKNIKKTITAYVLFLAALLTVLQILFGWMGGICRFLTSK